MSWIDDFVQNTQNAVADARKLGQTLQLPNPAPPQPTRVYPGTVAGMNTTTLMIVGAVVVGLLLWKKIG